MFIIYLFYMKFNNIWSAYYMNDTTVKRKQVTGDILPFTPACFVY